MLSTCFSDLSAALKEMRQGVAQVVECLPSNCEALSSIMKKEMQWLLITPLLKGKAKPSKKRTFEKITALFQKNIIIIFM
jgi:hypothetical protein